MILATAGIMSAQTPVFGYQATVRDKTNALVVNTTVGVTISALDATNTVVYEETQSKTTNKIGMVSILVGTGNVVTGDITAVDWANATMKVTFDIPAGAGQTVEVTSEVPTVPYALQAGKLELNTGMIAEYLEDSNTQTADFHQLETALRDNAREGAAGDLAAMIKDTLVNYIINHREIAHSIALHWLANADSADVAWAYNTLYGTDVFDTAVQMVVDYAKNHRDIAVEAVAYFLHQTTPDQINQAINSVDSIHQALAWSKIVNFVINNRSRAIQTLGYFLHTASAQEVDLMLNLFIHNEHNLKNTIINQYFFHHLNEYLPSYYTPALSDNEISQIVNHILDTLDNYLQDPSCNVNICTLRETVNGLLGQ